MFGSGGGRVFLVIKRESWGEFIDGFLGRARESFYMQKTPLIIQRFLIEF